MALNATGLNVMADGLRAVATHLSLHSADPGSTGTNHTNHGRVAASWPAASGGSLTISNKAFTGGTANGAVTHVGLWSAAGTGTPATGGTFYGGFPLTGDQTSNAAGEYTITSLTINGSSS